MSNYAFVGEKPWLNQLFEELSSREGEEWVHLRSKEDFTEENLKDLKITKVFIPHWSYIIPASIWENYECIVFHMTDLPFGRGGSPLQNLIVRGLKETKISALRVEAGIDTGKIYLKQPMSLLGTAQEIFLRSTEVIGQMIRWILDEDSQPSDQEGEPTVFKRRKPADSNMASLENTDQVYDYIRMLDCEGYPPAFIEAGDFRFEFSRASMKADKSVVADVRIRKK